MLPRLPLRCSLCRGALLPHAYMKLSESGSLICAHHVTDSTGYRSLDGSPVSSLPRYPTGENRDSAGPEGDAAGAAGAVAERASPRRVTGASGGSGRPVPAPRRTLDSCTLPVAAPRAKTSEPSSSSAAAGDKAAIWSPSVSLLSLRFGHMTSVSLCRRCSSARLTSHVSYCCQKAFTCFLVCLCHKSLSYTEITNLPGPM